MWNYPISGLPIPIHSTRRQIKIKIEENSTSLYLEPFWGFRFCNLHINVENRIISAQQNLRLYSTFLGFDTQNIVSKVWEQKLDYYYC